MNAPVLAISGGSRGIGLAIARGFAEHGWSVALLCRPGGESDAIAARDAIRATGARAVVREADVAEEADVTTALDSVIAELGRIDVVVNAAGYLPLATVAELDLGDLDRLHRTLVRGMLVLARESARWMRPGGVIVTLTSELVDQGIPGTAAYVAGKAAVNAMTAVLANELAPAGVRINALAVRPTGEDAAMLKRTGWRGAEGVETEIAAFAVRLVGAEGDLTSGRVVHAAPGFRPIA